MYKYLLFCSYCFIHGTKSLKWNKTGEIYDTIGPTADCSEAEGESECITHHPHYMWIPLFTLVQAAISYLPHYLWYYWEGEQKLINWWWWFLWYEVTTKTFLPFDQNVQNELD